MKRRLSLILLAPAILLISLTALAIGLLRAASIDELNVLLTVFGSPEPPKFLRDNFGLIRFPLQLIFVVVIFLLAWYISRQSDRLAGWLLRAARYDAAGAPAGEDESGAGPDFIERRRRTVQQLVSGFITFIIFTLAIILAMSQFFSLSNLAIVATVGANAFGFAARDYIGDMLNGVSNIFENRFNVGDNVSIVRVSDKIEGVIERMSVRTLSIRTRAGELINVPQGEVRILRNYTRGSYTGVDVICKVRATDLPAAMAVLQELAQEAPERLPDCIAPWTLVSRDGVLGGAAEIRIHAKADYGYGAGLRLRIMILVEERLSAAGIPLVNS
ncbi:MAG: mechanosensitive ion channel family protein [Anaerolineae bacterium]|nr:mechanosensitive ion channel family protein [Anaerolineae bacterium]